METLVAEGITRIDSCHRVQSMVHLVVEISHSWLLRVLGQPASRNLEGVGTGIIVEEEAVVQGKGFLLDLVLVGEGLVFLAVLEG